MAMADLCDLCRVPHQRILSAERHSIPHVCKVVHGPGDKLLPVWAVVNTLQGGLMRILHCLQQPEGVQVPQPDGSVM